MYYRSRFIFPLVLVYLAGAALGQTTQPAASADAWQATVETVAHALSEGDRSALQPFLSDRPLVRSLRSESGLSIDSLLARTSNCRVIAAHGYQQPAATVAADLAADFRAATFVPDAVRDHMTLDDEAQTRHANTVATQWITQCLEPDRAHMIAVIVLWPDATPNPAAGSPTPPEQPLFVLLKADVAADTFHITRIVFGISPNKSE